MYKKCEEILNKLESEGKIKMSDYQFPPKQELKLKLKDMLESEVDEKYYLSDKMLNYCFGVNQKGSKFPRKERFLQSLKQTNDKSIATTITTNAGNRPTDNFIFNKALKKTLEQNKIKQDISFADSYNKKIRYDGLSSTITTRINDSNNTFIAIKNATKKGYLEATDGDGIDISIRMEHHRGNVQKDKIQTLTTSGGNDRGVCVETYQYAKSDKFMNGKDRLQLGKETSDTLQTTPKEGVCYNDLRIRKLTPREAFRLMGFDDEDYEKASKVNSNTQLYKQAGNSIVVNVLVAIFKELIK